VNIIDMLEQELEGNWPFWLKAAVNDIIALLEKLYHGMDGERERESSSVELFSLRFCLGFIFFSFLFLFSSSS
jgi:hypothetical protein